MPDRFHEHPQTVLVVTNMYYSQAPWLHPGEQRLRDLNWIEVPLTGNTAHEFEQQIEALNPKLAEAWQVRVSENTGNPLYERPSVLVIYPHDQRYFWIASFHGKRTPEAAVSRPVSTW